MKKLALPIFMMFAASISYAQVDFDISDLPDINDIESSESNIGQSQSTTTSSSYTTQQGTYDSINIDGENQEQTNDNENTIPWIRNGWRVGMNVGPTFFAGDIMGETSDVISDMQIQAGFSLEKRICAPIDARLGTSSGRFRGSQATFSDGSKADVYFNNYYFDLDFNLKLDLVKMFYENTPFSVYLTGGIGYCKFISESKRLTNDDYVNHEDDECIIFPVGAGINFRIADRWNVNIEGVMKLANADNLDTRTANVYDKKLADMYGIGKFSIVYTFGGAKKDNVIIKEVIRYVEPLEEEVVTELPIEEEPTLEVVEPEPQIVAETTPTPIAPVEAPIAEPKQTKASANSTGDVMIPGLTYRIQILAKQDQTLKDKEIQQKYGSLGKIDTEVDTDGLKKYYVGSFQTLNTAITYRDILLKKGIKNAFIVPFKDNKRIDNQTARTLRGE